jgi:hypothetical protein
LRERDLGRDLKEAKIALNDYFDRWSQRHKALDKADKPVRERKKVPRFWYGQCQPNNGQRNAAAR